LVHRISGGPEEEKGGRPKGIPLGWVSRENLGCTQHGHLLYQFSPCRRENDILNFIENSRNQHSDVKMLSTSKRTDFNSNSNVLEYNILC
jgi:hypothetical protein